MLARFLTKLADDQQTTSPAARLRKGRFALFKSLVESVPTPLKVLDAGGAPGIWEREGFCDRQKDVEILLLNVYETEVSGTNIKSVVGDVRAMPQFQDSEFDVVFSNSVIEHVGDYEEQRQMANEIRRVGKRYFLQTPNRYFPIEPHFLFPFFQFLPLWTKVWLVTNFRIGWSPKFTDKKEAADFVSSVKLLNKQQVLDLFPGSTLYEEKVFGLTKSFVVYDGWEITTPAAKAPGAMKL